MRVLVSGGMGFIGSHFCENIHRHTNWDIVVIDKLSYATRGFDRFRSNGLIDSSRVKPFTWDLCSPLSKGLIYEIGNVDIIVHFAAETHVDNSIDDPVFTIENNVKSTLTLLEYARTLSSLKEFIYFSTDEVFGPASFNINDTTSINGEDMYTYKEWDRVKPTNAYSSSKSASEGICLAYRNTYRIPLKIVNVMNVIGERQHTEKFVPKVMKALMEDKTIDIHCRHSDTNELIPSTRYYIHARNVADAVLFIINNGEQGQKYNISGEREVDNLEMAQMIAKYMGKELKYKLIDYHTNTRWGHDSRYSLNSEKLRKMGWVMPVPFEESLEKTVKWTMNNVDWLKW